MKLPLPIPLLSLLTLVACGGEWVAGDTSKVSCSLSESPFSSAVKLSVSADGELLYILDLYGDTYVYSRNDARTCAFELSRTEYSDGKIGTGSAQEIESVGSYLYYYDGISVLRAGDEDWSCDVSLNAVAMTASFIYAAPSGGIKKYKVNSMGCANTGVSFSATRVQALDATSSLVATVETSGALSDPPQRFSVYDASGNLEARSALASGDTSNSLYFRSATRLRIGSSFAVLLDAEGGYLGVFNLSGGLEHRLKLSEIGIRNPVDIDVRGDDLYILTGSSVEPLYYLDFASYSWGEE